MDILLIIFQELLLTPEKIAAMNEIYEHYIKKEVQHLW